MQKSTGKQPSIFATEDIAWKDLAAVLTEVTGKKAVYKDVSLDEYFRLGITRYGLPMTRTRVELGYA